MNKTQYQKYLQGNHWKKLRRRYYAKYGYYCKRCGRAHNLNLHHLTYKNLGREKLEDLESLCRYCHMKEHGLIQEKEIKWGWKFKLFVTAVILWMVIALWFYGK